METKPLNIKPIEKLVLIDQIIETIGRQIAEGALRPGDTLPGERILAKMLKVSRTSVRQALKALDVLGVLDIRPGSRTYLNKSVSKLLVNPMKFIILLHDIETNELFKTRKLIEVELAKLAAENATEEHIKNIESVLEKAKNSLDDPQKFLDLEIKFHDCIFEASGNKILFAMMASINNLLLETREKTVKLFKGKLKDSYDQHFNILTAIKSKNVEEAGNAMYKHLDKIEDMISELGGRNSKKN